MYRTLECGCALDDAIYSTYCVVSRDTRGREVRTHLSLVPGAPRQRVIHGSIAEPTEIPTRAEAGESQTPSNGLGNDADRSRGASASGTALAPRAPELERCRWCDVRKDSKLAESFCPASSHVDDPHEWIQPEPALCLEVSYDAGRSWKPVMRLNGDTTTRWRITVSK